MSFQYVQPTEEQKLLMQDFRNDYEKLFNKIKAILPKGRGVSSAITKLEESAFWLNKGITNNDLNE